MHLAVALCLVLLPHLVSAAFPTENPVAARYGKDAYPWTDTFAWDRVFSVADEAGDDDGRAQAAIEKAAAAGGGVVYFPAGVYRFKRDLVLRPGVILRGDKPVSDAKSGFGEFPARLVFPKFNPSLEGEGTPVETAFKKIRLANPRTDGRVGVVHVDVNRAGIQFDEEDANAVQGTNKLVFGVRLNNCATPDPKIPLPWQHGWQRWPLASGRVIGVSTRANALVADCRINDRVTDDFEQPGFRVLGHPGVSSEEWLKMTVPPDPLPAGWMEANISKVFGLTEKEHRLPGQATFVHTEGRGIRVNWLDDGHNVSPSDTPGFYRPGIVIRDNWMFMTGGVGILAAGQGLVVKDNVRRDRAGILNWVDYRGKYESSGAILDWYGTYGVQIGGSNIVVEGNDLRVENQTFGWGSAKSCRGAFGILASGSKALFDGLTVRGNAMNQPIRFLEITHAKNILIENNKITGLDKGFLGCSIIVSAHDMPRTSLSDLSILGNEIAGGIYVYEVNASRNIKITGNRSVSGGNFYVPRSSEPILSGNRNFRSTIWWSRRNQSR